jgi:2-phosphosulfolactate phosphatase
MSAAPTISVVFEPSARSAANLAGASAVVIDAIRATTTIVAALAAGCREVVPFRTEAEVRAEAARRPAGSVVTAGERGGRPIAGLDVNNSPSVMTPDRVGGRSLLLTTTNGTQAILDALAARDVLIAALPNRRAVARRLAALGRRVVFLPAGTEGDVSCEDTLVAGAVIAAMLEVPEPAAGAAGDAAQAPRAQNRITEPPATAGSRGPATPPQRWHLDDSARVALAAWRGVVSPLLGQALCATAGLSGRAEDRLLNFLRLTRGGSAILRLGLDADLATCAQVDTMDVVPVARGRPPVITAG